MKTSIRRPSGSWNNSRSAPLSVLNSASWVVARARRRTSPTAGVPLRRCQVDVVVEPRRREPSDGRGRRERYQRRPSPGAATLLPGRRSGSAGSRRSGPGRRRSSGGEHDVAQALLGRDPQEQPESTPSWYWLPGIEALGRADPVPAASLVDVTVQGDRRLSLGDEIADGTGCRPGIMTGSPEPSYWTASAGIQPRAPDRSRCRTAACAGSRSSCRRPASSSTTSRTRPPRSRLRTARVGCSTASAWTRRATPSRCRGRARSWRPDVAQCPRRGEHRVDLRRVVVAGHHERLGRSAREAFVGERQPLLQSGHLEPRERLALTLDRPPDLGDLLGRGDEAIGPFVAGDPDELVDLAPGLEALLALLPGRPSSPPSTRRRDRSAGTSCRSGHRR